MFQTGSNKIVVFYRIDAALLSQTKNKNINLYQPNLIQSWQTILITPSETI